MDKKRQKPSYSADDSPDVLTRKMQDYDAESADEFYSDLFSVASSTECTGLVPSAAYTDDEVDSYTDIYAIPLQKDDTQHMRGQHR